MKKLVENFPSQLQEAMEIGSKASFTPSKNSLTSVLISGLGGSGIGGSIVSELCSQSATLPITVNKDYFLPSFVNQNTLVIISSYSGNTEETLQVMEEAIRRNAKIVCISSGGKVIELAKKNNFDHVIVPGGMPPRSCLGYSLTQLFFVLNAFGIINDAFKNQMKQAIALIVKDRDAIRVEALRIAGVLKGKLPIIYACAGSEGVAIRFRQQINENSKELCWHHVIPEMNHNELVGWRRKNDELAVVFLRNKTDYARNELRRKISEGIISEYCSTILEIVSKGESNLERAIYLIHLTDHISVDIATLKGADPVEVEVINHLKGELAKF